MAIAIEGYYPITHFKKGYTITSISNLTYYIDEIIKHGTNVVYYSIVNVDDTGEPFRFNVGNTEPVFKLSVEVQKVVHVKLSDLWNTKKL